MFRKSLFHLSACILLLISIAGFVQAQTTEYIGTTPMTKDEIMSRVRSAYGKNGGDVDDIAADVDRRGIDFDLDTLFANQIRFMRATVVTNALWRADDRRKAMTAKPKNPETLEELKSKSDTGSQPFIEKARAEALAYVDALPNFIVSEQVQRYLRSASGAWKLGDYLEMAVSYAANRGEEIKLKLQNGRAAAVTIDEVGGLTSTGQFAGQLAMLFDPVSRTEFVDKGTTNLFGQPCAIYGYRVETKNSRYQLKLEKAQVVTGCRGLLYINSETKRVLRMELEAIEIPPDFPITAASSTVDFGWVAVGAKEFLLPVGAQVYLTVRQNNFSAFNSITFTKYGKFETDVKILN